MKTISIEEFRADVDQFLAEAASDDIVLMQDGEPYALLQAIPNGGILESEAFARSPEFWQMIRERRREPTIPWQEAKSRLAVD